MNQFGWTIPSPPSTPSPSVLWACKSSKTPFTTVGVKSEGVDLDISTDTALSDIPSQIFHDPPIAVADPQLVGGGCPPLLPFSQSTLGEIISDVCSPASTWARQDLLDDLDRRSRSCSQRPLLRGYGLFVVAFHPKEETAEPPHFTLRITDSLEPETGIIENLLWALHLPFALVE